MMSEFEFDHLGLQFYETLDEYVELVQDGADIPNALAKRLLHLESDYEHECEVRGI